MTKNHLQASELPNLITAVHAAFGGLGEHPVVAEEPAKLVPLVSIRKFVTDDYMVSMEDGKRFKSLKRHLGIRGLTPAQYREKCGLPSDYPMVAPAYAAKRSELAKTIGLGRRAAQDGIEAKAEAD